MADTPEDPKGTRPVIPILQGLQGLSKAHQEALANLGSNLPKFSIPVYNTDEETPAERDLVPQAVGAGKDEKKSKPRTKPKRTSLDRIPGRRPMKEYPLTEDDLDTIGLLQGSAAVAFGAAGTCLGLFLSIRMAIDFAGDGVAPTKVAWWAGLGIGALVVAVALFAAGLMFRHQGKTRVNSIKEHTTHEE